MKDGDDYNTRTKYIGPEYNLGDSLKVILLQIYDILEFENLQVHEIKALLEATVNEHIIETDELNDDPSNEKM